MGIGGGRVDAATVLRGVRGELNRCRETAVREVFRGLLDLSYVGAEAQRKRAIGGSGTSSGDWGDMDVSGFRSRSLPRESRGGERGDLNFAVPIEQLQKAWCIGSAVDKALLLGGNPNGRGFGTEDASGGVISHESRAKYIDDTQGHLTDQRARKRQGRGSLNGVTLEQFLEYYRCEMRRTTSLIVMASAVLDVRSFWRIGLTLMTVASWSSFLRICAKSMSRIFVAHTFPESLGSCRVRLEWEW